MLSFAKAYFILFGLFSLAGGVIGYTKVGSVASLVAGAVSGLLLAGGGWFLRPDATPVFIGLAVICGALLYRFGPLYLNEHKLMPAGLLSIMSIAGLVVLALAFFNRGVR